MLIPRFRPALALTMSVLLLAISLPAVASAADNDGEITVETYVTNHQGEVPTISAGKSFSVTETLSCTAPNTGYCTDTVATFTLPEPAEFSSTPIADNAAYTWSVSGRVLTVTFTSHGLPSGSLSSLVISAAIPADASADLDAKTVSAKTTITAANADTVTDATSFKLDIPTALTATTTKKVSPTGTQPALAGRAVTFTITGANSSNASVDSVQISEPSNPSNSTPFTSLEVTDITTLTAPQRADRVEFEWYDGSNWTSSGVVAIPADPSTLLPSDPSSILGMRFSFTNSGGQVPVGDAGKVVVSTKARQDAFTDLAAGESQSIVNKATTTVKLGSDSADDQATTTTTFTKTDLSVTTTKSFNTDDLVAGGSTVVTIDATSGIMPISGLQIDEPSAGQPDLASQGLTFGGFITSGTTDQKVEWPNGATEVTLTYYYSDGTSDSAQSTEIGSMPAATTGKVVTSFSVKFTGANDAIVSGATARLAFQVTANAVTQEAGTTATNTAKTTVTDADGATAADTNSDSITLLPQRVRTDASKTLSRSSLWAAPGSAMTVSLTGSVSQESTIGSNYLSLTDDTAAFWDSFNLRRIVSTDIPANANLTVEYFDATSSSWQTLTTQAGPVSNWSYTPSNPDAIAGLRFTYTAKNSGELLPIGFNAAPRFEVVLRSTLRSDPLTSTNPTDDSTIAEQVTTEVNNTSAIAPTSTDTASAAVTLRPTEGSSSAPDLISKHWVTDSGLATEDQVDALSGDTATARIDWGSDGLNMSQFQVTDDPRGVTDITASAYDAFDLVAINPITTSVDPLIGADKITKVELYNGSDWTDITTAACAAGCDGGFGGYTLTDAERASTTSVRLTFAPGSASTTGSLATDDSATPNRGILLTMKLRNTLRSAAGTYVLGTSHSHTYNTGSAGVVNNVASAVGTLTTPTAANTTAYGDSASANVIIYDRPLNISMSKSFDQTRLGLPQSGTAAASYPLITSTLTVTNETATQVPEISVSDPNADVSGLGAYEYLNLYQLDSSTLPANLTADDVTVDLTHFDGTTTTTETALPLASALAKTPTELADVIGVSVHYGAESHLADSTANLIASGASATLKLTYQLRSTVRSTGEATAAVEKVTNSAKASIVSPGGLGCASGQTCNTPTTSASASFGIAAPTFAVSASKSISPSSRYEDQSSSYTLTLSGQPSGTARANLLTLTDITPTFWNSFDLATLSTVAVPTPINQLKLDVLTGVDFSYDSTTNTLSYTCAGSTDLSGCWHEGSWTSSAEGVVQLTLPSGIDAAAVRGVSIQARRVVDGNPVQWERPANPTVSIPLNTTRRVNMHYDRNGATTTPVPSTRPGMALAPGESTQGTISNSITATGTAAWLDQGNTWTASADANAQTQLLHRTNQIKVEKTPGQGTSSSVPRYDLNQTIGFQLKVTNTGDWNATGLQVSDQVEVIGGTSGLVPATDVTDVFTFKLNGSTATGFSANLDQTTGKVTITTPSDFVLTPGSVLLITANLRFRDQLAAGRSVSNSVSVKSDRDFERCEYTEDAVAATPLTNVSECTATTKVIAAASTPITIAKAVKGVGAGDPSASVGAANYDDLGVISVGNTDSSACASADTDGYYLAPCTPITRPGGTERWRLTMTNGGNVAANTVSVIDVLPAVGDNAVTVSSARKSRFTPTFAGNIQLSLPDGTADHTTKSYFSTTTPTATCNKLAILNDTTPGGVTDCGITWTEITGSTTASQLASAKTIRVVVAFDDAAAGLSPGSQFKLSFDTVTPSQSTIADNSTVEPVAWNSAAIGSRTAYVAATDDTSAFAARASLITETRKVGVAIASGKLNVAKTVSVPDGASWSAALPTSYSGKLSCSSLGTAVSLNGTTTSASTSALTLPGTQGSGTGAAQSYNSDGSSNLPLFASCTFDEDSAQGASVAAGTVTAQNDYSGIANIANGWAGAQPETLGVTNTYRNAGFTVSKSVTGPVAKDASGTAVSFKDFTYTASCTLNGTEVIPEAQRTFTLRDNGSQQFADLPAGATCTVTETYQASAAETTTSVTQSGDSTTHTGTSATFTLISGDSSATMVAYTNRFTVGAVHITKTVIDPTGYWGNEAFEARLVCTHSDTTNATVYDGLISLTKAAPEKTVTSLPTDASCTVTETKSGGANDTAITGGTFSVGSDPAQPSEVGITNTFTTGSVQVTKTVQANGVATTAKPWNSGSFPVTLNCTRSVDGTDTAVTVPGDATRSLTSAGDWKTTYTDLPTGASCSVTENAAGSVAGQPDPTVTITDPVTVGNGTTAAIGVTNNFAAGKLVVHKTLNGVGTSFFTTAKYSAVCTLDGYGEVFTASNVAVSNPALASAEIGPIPFGSSCTVSETDTGGADATPDAQTVSVDQNAATSDVTSLTFVNSFSAGTVTIVKNLTGEAAGESWATTPYFSLAVKCGKTATGTYSYDQTVSLQGNSSVQLKDGNGNALLFPVGTHCWATETVTNGAASASVDHNTFDTGVTVLSSPEAVQDLAITATNAYTYSGFTVSKDVVTSGATDADGNLLVYNPSFNYSAKCVFNGSTVLDTTFSSTKQTDGSWSSWSTDKLPTGASCTVTETNTGSATSTSIKLTQSGSAATTTSATATTFTLVKGDTSVGNGETAANQAAFTNTYGVGSASITKTLTGAGATTWATQPFQVRLTCTAAFTTATDGIVYDKTFTFQRGVSLATTVSNLPTGASCTVTESVNGGANSTSYTNQNFTVSTSLTAATVTNTFTQGTVKVQNYTRTGTASSPTDVSTMLPWKNTKFDVTLTCVRNIGGGNTETITKTATLTGATSTSWAMPTGASCTVNETGVTYPTDTPAQPDYTTAYNPTAATITTGTATLAVYNYFGYGNVKVSKTLEGEAAQTWGGGKFTFAVVCTMPQNGASTTVYSNAAVTAQRSTSSQTSFTSATLGPIAVGAVCTATETNTAGATSTSPASVTLDAVDNVLAGGTTKTAAFTNTFSYAGFTVTKSVDVGGAKDQNGLAIKYTGSYSFTANCTYNNGISTTTSALSENFSLKDGESKQFVNLPVGAQCTVAETGQANANTVSYQITQNGTSGSQTTATTSSAITLVRSSADANDPSASTIAFTNHYTTGSLRITKLTTGAGVGLWDGGTFTVKADCTLTDATANDSSSSVYSATHQLAKNETWTISDLPTSASCVTSEVASAGANGSPSISNATATIGNGTSVASTVTNTFNTGSVSVTKVLKANGSVTSAEPWASASYQLTLHCEKDFNDDTTAETITVADATKTVTGAGTATWNDLPQGATCRASEGTITYPSGTPTQPAPTSVEVGADVAVGNATTVTQTVTNNFDFGTAQITKELSGEAAATWGGAPYSFTLSCTLNGSTGAVFEAKNVQLQRSGTETTLTSALLGPIPQGAACTATETDQGWASSVSPATSQSLATITAANTSGVTFTNNFTYAGFTVTKTVHSDALDAAAQPVKYTAAFPFTASCKIGATEFLTTDQQSFTLTDGASKEFTNLPTGAACTVTETNSFAVASTAVRIQTTTTDVTTAGSKVASFNLIAGSAQATQATFTNNYSVGGLLITKKVTGAGASSWGNGNFTVKAECTLSDATANNGDPYVFSATHQLAKDDSWTISNLPTDASCAVSETNVGGANVTSIDVPNPTITEASTQPVTVTNTFRTGSLKVTKSITANGTSVDAQAPWSSGSYPVTLKCLKDFNGDGSDEALTFDDSFKNKTITGAGTATWTGLPEGATCTVEEGTSSVTGQPQPTASIGSTAIGNGTTAALTLTNEFAAGRLVIHKDLTGAGATTWGTGTFHFHVACTLTGFGTVFSASDITVTPSSGQTSLDSTALGPIPFGSQCSATETDSAGATAVTSPDAVSITQDDATNNTGLATFTNEFDFAGFTVTKAVDNGGAVNQDGVEVQHDATVDYRATCTFVGNTVLDQTFSLAHQSGSTWESKEFTKLPVGASCSVTETGTGAASSTQTVITQNGSAGTPGNGTTAAFTLVRGTGAMSPDSAAVTTVGFTNSYAVGGLTVTKEIVGLGAAAWGDTSFDLTVRCTADLDANPATANTIVFEQAKTLTKAQPTWQLSNLVAGASCAVTETAWGGATQHPDTQTATITADAITAVTVTNTFSVGSVKVSKAFTVDGSAPTKGWADQLSDASAVVELTCTRDINGTTTPVDVPGDATRTLSSSNSFTSTYSGLPANANCVASETGSTPLANSVSLSPSSDVTVPDTSTAAVTLTNDYHTGTLTITKKVTGAGAAFGKGPFTFAVRCRLSGLNNPVFITDGVQLTAVSPTSAALGPIPVGAVCEVTETDSAGATSGASKATVSIPDDTASNNAAAVTMTNDFELGSLTVSKTVDNGGALDQSQNPITYPGSYGFTASCTFASQGEVLSSADQSFTLVDGSSKTISGLPQGASCTVTETGTGKAASTTSSVNGATATQTDTANVVISPTEASVAFTNHYLTGAATITKTVTGSGADVWGNEPFTLRTSCTLDTDHDSATAAVNVFNATATVSKSAPTWKLTKLPTGAECAVSEEAVGGANTAAVTRTFVVNSTPETPTLVTMTNEFTVGAVRIDKVIKIDGQTSSDTPYDKADFQVQLTCTRSVNGADVAVDIPGDGYPAGDPADGLRTITGANSVSYQGLPTGASCTASEISTTMPLPTTQVSVSQPGLVGVDTTKVATITNDYHTATMSITKVITGAGGDAWGGTAAVFSVACTLTDTNKASQTVFSIPKLTLSRPTSLTSDQLGPIPVGSVCTVTETGTGGATVAASPATLTIVDGDANSVTMTNQFDVGTVITSTELTLDGAMTTAAPFTGSKIGLTLTCDREVNGVWTSLSVPDAEVVVTGAGSHSFSGLPIGARCSLTQTGASLPPQAVTYRSSPQGPTTTISAPVTVSAQTTTLTAINDFTTGSLIVEKVLTGAGAQDFAVHPFKFSISCTLAEVGVTQPHSVFTKDDLVLSKADGLVSGALGPIPVGSECLVTETADGGATTASKPVSVTISSGADNRATLTNNFDAGSVKVTKKIVVDGTESNAEPFASGKYTMKLDCTQLVDGQTLPVTIPGGATRTITGAGTAEFSALPLGAACEISESTPLTTQTTISDPRFTIGVDPTEVTVTNAFSTTSLVVRATFNGVGRETFAKPLQVSVSCTLAGISDPVFQKVVTITPQAQQLASTSESLGPIPVGANCKVATLSAVGADSAPSEITVTGVAGSTAIADLGATYSAGTVTVTKKLTGSGAQRHLHDVFKMAITCSQSANSSPNVTGKVSITGAGSATLTDSAGAPVLIPAHSHCWATETDNRGATAVTIDHSSFDSAVHVNPDVADSLQNLQITVTNDFTDPTPVLAYTGYELGWGLPGLALLSIGLGIWLVRRRPQE
jgi:large repetitive protein